MIIDHKGFFTRNCHRLALTLAVCSAFAISVSGAGTGQAIAADETPAANPLDEPIKLAEMSAQAAAEVDDFRAVFKKQELVNGKMIQQAMDIKFREEPFSVYLRFHPPFEGREVLYYQGRNENKMLVKPEGLLSVVGTVSIDPASPRATAESLHPITEIGLEKMVAGIVEMWKKEREVGDTQVKYYRKAKLGDRPCLVIETTHPRPRREFQYYMTRLYIDRESRLPVRLEHWGFPPRAGVKPPLIGEYTYSQIETNVGLGEGDFDPRNPQYDF